MPAFAFVSRNFTFYFFPAALAKQGVRPVGVLAGLVQQRELQRDGVRKVADRVDVREADEDLRGKEEQPLPVQTPQTLPLHE